MEFIPAGEDEAHRVTISGGISTYPCMPDVEEDANTVIRYAEHALYNAKHRGKNKIVQYNIDKTDQAFESQYSTTLISIRFLIVLNDFLFQDRKCEI